MATTNALLRRLGDLVARYADEVHRDGAQDPTTVHGSEISSLTHHLGLLLAGATPPNLATVGTGRIGYGSRVLVRDENTGQVETHHLMASHAMDLDCNHVSVESPLGVALLGKRTGAVVDVDTPSGLRRLRVLAVRSLEELLEVLDPQEADSLALAAR